MTDLLEPGDDRDPLVADLLRRHLGDEPPPRTDLSTELSIVLAAGRRARARRQVAAAVAGCIGAVAVVTAGMLARGDAGAVPLLPEPDVAGTSATPAPGTATATASSTADPPQSLVIPLVMQKRVHADLPRGLELVQETDYPSDWNRSTALPVTEAQNATDWHSRFSAADRPGNKIWLSVFIAPPRSNPTEAELRAACPVRAVPDPLTGAPGCRVDKLGKQSFLLTQITRTTGDRWTRTVLHYRPGDRVVNAREQVTARSYAEAARQWSYTPAQLAVLAKDPHLVFPHPVRRPPLPR